MVAVIEMHINSTQPLYCEEADQHKNYYYPPAGGVYPNGWLWYDGNPHIGKDPSVWEDSIVSRMNQPSVVTITMWGYYSHRSGSGTIYAQFRNDSTDTIDGRVFLVLTEDSIYYPATNYDSTHNHVARDYLPDENGVKVSIPAGDSITVNQHFSIPADWNDEQCRIIAWIQNDIPQSDSTKEIWQGGMKSINELSICEKKIVKSSDMTITTIPEPCRNFTVFVFNLPAGLEYQIDIFDIMGRRIRTLKGESIKSVESVEWDCRDDGGFKVCKGVYLYCFKSSLIKTSGKITVR